MTKRTKGQGLLGYLIIIAVVALIIILVLNPDLSLHRALIVLWGKIIAGFSWLLAGAISGNLVAIAIVILIVLGIIALLSRL